MTISETGSKIFIAQGAWKRYCAQNHIADPFEMIRDIEDEYHHYKELYDEKGNHQGTAIVIDEPTEEQKNRLDKAKKYRTKYMIDREIWVGEYIFKNFGYDVLSTFAQTHSPSESAFHEWYSAIHPCDGANRQCSFWCSIFGACGQ